VKGDAPPAPPVESWKISTFAPRIRRLLDVADREQALASSQLVDDRIWTSFVSCASSS
jgi:hypothetical protein